MGKYSKDLPAGFAKNQAIAQAKIFVFDWDGVIGATEVVQQIAFKLLLEELTGREHDLHEVERNAVGHSIHEIFEGYIKDNNLKMPVEALLKRHVEIYQKLIRDNKMGPNPAVLAILEYAKENGIPCVVLSNGREPNILHLIKEWHLEEYFENQVYAAEGEARQALAKNTGGKASDKAAFLQYELGELHISAEMAVMVEDNAGTLKKIQAKINGIQTIYIRQEFNKNDYIPTTGIIIDGYSGGLYEKYARRSPVRGLFIAAKYVCDKHRLPPRPAAKAVATPPAPRVR